MNKETRRMATQNLKKHEKLANRIKEIVEERPFILFNELIPETAELQVTEGFDIIEVINDVVAAGSIRALEYVDDNNIPDRIRVRLYPASFNIISEG